MENTRGDPHRLPIRHFIASTRSSGCSIAIFFAATVYRRLSQTTFVILCFTPFATLFPANVKVPVHDSSFVLERERKRHWANRHSGYTRHICIHPIYIIYRHLSIYIYIYIYIAYTRRDEKRASRYYINFYFLRVTFHSKLCSLCSFVRLVRE